MNSALVRHQRWLYRAITAPRAPRDPAAVLGGAAVVPAIGLGVYRHAYRARLRECLADDFPAVARSLGEASFERISDAFIAARPPCDATLNAYGRFFAPWLSTSTIRGAVRLGELAALEWALVEAIHAALGPAFDTTALARIPTDGWGDVRLVPTPSLRVIPCRWATNAAYEAYRAGSPPTSPRRVSGGIAVLRLDAGLRRHDLGALETRVLTRLLAGKTLARALHDLPPRGVTAVQPAFSRWIALGFFTALG
jgi:hypothetical protein